MTGTIYSSFLHAAANKLKGSEEPLPRGLEAAPQQPPMRVSHTPQPAEELHLEQVCGSAHPSLDFTLRSPR